MFDNFVSTLSDQFRRQYPQGSIISDLVQIHGDQYVVKVSVSLANTVLVSTLAADANLTLAENCAMERALTILGIRDLQQPAHEPVNLTVTPLPDLPIGLTNSIAEDTSEAIIEDTHPEILANSEPVSNLPIPVVTLAETTESPIIIEEIYLSPVPAITAAEPIRIQVGVASEISEQLMDFNATPSFTEPEAENTMPIANGKVAVDSNPPEIPAILPELPIEAVPEVSVTTSSRSKKAAPTSDSLSTATDEAPLDETMVPIAEPPLSVTDMIPMINMELKRLGWSKDRGREYMVSLYNKRASALLSDDELFGLLQHLQAEPLI
jgi:hypothetical protein